MARIYAGSRFFLNNQNCCKSIIFFSTQAPEHETTGRVDGGGWWGFELYKELAYNRKNSLSTHWTRHSQPRSLHPWGDCTSWGGWKYKLHMIRLFSLSLSQHTQKQSLTPTPRQTLINRPTQLQEPIFGLQATVLNNSSIIINAYSNIAFLLY